MVLAASTTVIAGWVLLVAGFIFVVLSVPALLRKAYQSPARTMDWSDVVQEAIKAGGAAAVVAVIGVGMMIVGLIMIGVKLPKISG